MKCFLPDEAATMLVGAALGRAMTQQHGFITLAGDLGAGKTTLVRSALRALGHAGPVRSPTYTLIETYSLSAGLIHHLDWYRLASDDELDSIGFRDLLAPGNSVLVEWPERIPIVAARSDLSVALSYEGDGRSLSAAADTVVGADLLRLWMTEIG